MLASEWATHLPMPSYALLFSLALVLATVAHALDPALLERIDAQIEKARQELAERTAATEALGAEIATDIITLAGHANWQVERAPPSVTLEREYCGLTMRHIEGIRLFGLKYNLDLWNTYMEYRADGTTCARFGVTKK
jgi:hypothetical protein